MNVKAFRQSNVPRQMGEQARIRILQGPDVGATFVVLGREALIGRDEKADVALSDLKASRHHAQIEWTEKGWQIRDLGSANGIIHEGQVTKAARLRTGDRIGLGETVFEFLLSQESTQILQASPIDLDRRHRDQVLANQSQSQRVQGLVHFGLGSSASPSGFLARGKGTGDQKVLRLAVVGVLGGVVVFVFFDDAPKVALTPPEKTAPETDPVLRDLASYLPQSVNPEVAKTSDIFFRLGFREFRERNYLRAKTHFETVLQVDPSHRLARMYVQQAQTEINAEVDAHLKAGAKSREAGKYSAAQAHFEAVMRLLYREPTHQKYIEAQSHLKEMEGKRKGRS